MQQKVLKLNVLSARFGPRSSKWLSLALVHALFNKLILKMHPLLSDRVYMGWGVGVAYRLKYSFIQRSIIKPKKITQTFSITYNNAHNPLAS